MTLNVKYHLLDDFLLVSESPEIVVKGAEHPNAAILLVLFLASPEGLEFQKSTGYCYYLDPDTNEHAMVAEAESKGIPIKYSARDEAFIEWLLTEESTELAEQVDLVIKGE